MTQLRIRDLKPIKFFAETWGNIDKDAEQERNQFPHGHLSTTIYVYVISAACLILSDLNYMGGEASATTLIRFLDDLSSAETSPILWALLSWLKPAEGSIEGSQWFELWHLGYWSVIKVIAYFGIPMLAIAVHPNLCFRDIGFSLKGFSSHFRVYAILFVPVLILVIIVSFSDEFTDYYPFYRHSARSVFDFWIWQVFYIGQFFALEFFFRGFMLQPVFRTMGSSAILATMLPYVMIHFGKPMLECFAAIIAGIVLGILALRTRSIWAGFLIHVSIALSMDIFANLQKEGLRFLHTISGGLLFP